MTGTSADPDGAAATPDLPLLHNRYEIDYNDPLPGLASGQTPAYAAYDQRSPDRRLIAYVCCPELPIRLYALSRLRKGTPAHMLPLIEAGTVDWPPFGRRALVVIYRRPLGGSLAAHFASADRARNIASEVAAPVIQALGGLATLGFAHRAIRPDNAYFLDEARTELVLGDCVTAPAGFAQPAAMETIERAMAMPAGRGEGSLQDDFYALGVMLVDLVCGGRGFGDEAALLTAKATKGSFAALCDHRRIPSALIDPLRGLLADDPARRWSFGQAENWLAGRLRAQAGGGLGTIVPAPFVFGEHAYTSRRLLAQALAADVPAAAAVIRSGELQEWLTRRANAETMARAVSIAAAAQHAARGTSGGEDDYLVARVAAILDPRGTVRFRGLRFMRDGFGPALAASWLIQGDARTPATAVAMGLADPPLEEGEAIRGRRGGIGGDIPLSRMIELPGMAGGLERCLYATNPGLACRSPLIADAHVIVSENLLVALDEAVARENPKDLPIDHHIAAFIAARADIDVEAPLKDLTSRRYGRAVLAALTILAKLQPTNVKVLVPALARWFVAHLDEIIDSYQSRSRRAMLRKRLPQLASKGQLMPLLELVNDPKCWHEDRQGARTASLEFAKAEKRIKLYRDTAEERRRRYQDLGQRLAATTATIAGIAATWATLIARVW